MLRAVAVVVLALSGCSATTSVGFVHRGDAAFARGDWSDAEESYKDAIADHDRDPWVRAKVEQGLARVALERTRRSGALAKLEATTPEALWAKLLVERKRIADLGGDDAMDAQIVGALSGVASAIIESAAKAPPAELLAASTRVQTLLALQDLDPKVRARGDAVIARARASLESTAATAGAARPLSRRIGVALAALHGGPPVGDAWSLARPFARGVNLEMTGASCSGLGDAIQRSLASPGGARAASVQIQIDTCTDSSSVMRSERDVTFTERQIVRWSSRTESVTKCSGPTTENYSCSILSTGTVCAYAGKSGSSCYQEDVQITEPIYGPVQVKRTLEIEQQRGSFEVAGRWTVRRDGQEWTGTFGERKNLGNERVPAYGSTAAKDTLEYFTEFQAVIATRATIDIRGRLETLFAADVEAASEAARALDRAGQLDDADEAWVRVALLGGPANGRWPARGITAEMIVRAFRPMQSEPGVIARPQSQVYPVPENAPTLTARDKANLIAALTPVGKHFYGDFGLGTASTPATTVGTAMLAGTSAAVLHTTFGTALVGWKNASPYGVKIVDDLSGRIEAGYVYDNAAETFDSKHGSVSIAYALGVSYRAPGLFGVMAGVRPEAAYAWFGGNTGSFAGVPAFGRLEVPFGRSSIAFEAYAPLAGDQRIGGAIYISRPSFDKAGEAERYSRFFTLRYDRRKVDATLDIPSLDPTIEETVDVEDLEMRSFSVSYGIGF